MFLSGNRTLRAVVPGAVRIRDDECKLVNEDKKMRECPHSVRWEEKSPGENEGLREDGWRLSEQQKKI